MKKNLYLSPVALELALRSEEILEESEESKGDLDLPFPGEGDDI